MAVQPFLSLIVKI